MVEKKEVALPVRVGVVFTLHFSFFGVGVELEGEAEAEEFSLLHFVCGLDAVVGEVFAHLKLGDRLEPPQISNPQRNSDGGGVRVEEGGGVGVWVGV